MAETFPAGKFSADKISVEKKMNIGFLGLGFLPIEHLENVPHVPKKRYSEIMRPYMKQLGGLGLDMMHRSCTVQANFDYTSEKDMKKKNNGIICASAFSYRSIC